MPISTRTTLIYPPGLSFPQVVRVGYRDIAKNWALLGYTAFGGPAAHIGIFQKASQDLRRDVGDTQAQPWHIATPFSFQALSFLLRAPTLLTPFRPQIFVDRLHWLTAAVFTELLALCQCLPGPTSTQLSFAIGALQNNRASDPHCVKL